ncbi:MAG: hypothetical protein CL524_15355 [Aequorivita sp.]|uniref:Lipocalin-like domain-containing protein n=2 Tax=Aequorivita vladivostokensis TaxID=171194 RepID=A0ABR5DJM6_9FLAO|nr:hypothetical protein MB09_05910 [Aequorivita vladivostokensis]MAB58903.1 hypothetical protein [Aequorivita sp.]MBF30782.1 hypothetical protein [Aequorivita sp.]HBL79412.1 hypothetical protein [Aequorivita sp.]
MEKTKIMKKILILFAIVTFASCSSDDDSGNVNTNEFENIKTTLPQGEWKVSKLIDGQSDHTMDFESFIFTFNGDGTVKAQNDLLTENGTWAYDNSSSSEELVLQFSEQTPFDEINDDWDIVSVTNSQIELSDISGGDGDVELLTFIKL